MCPGESPDFARASPGVRSLPKPPRVGALVDGAASIRPFDDFLAQPDIGLCVFGGITLLAVSPGDWLLQRRGSLRGPRIAYLNFILMISE
jgi:hypothetical protein